jgi:hypothetical protein
MSIRTEHSSLRQGLVGAWCPSLGATSRVIEDRSGLNSHGAIVTPAYDANLPSNTVAANVMSAAIPAGTIGTSATWSLWLRVFGASGEGCFQITRSGAFELYRHSSNSSYFSTFFADNLTRRALSNTSSPVQNLNPAAFNHIAITTNGVTTAVYAGGLLWSSVAAQSFTMRSSILIGGTQRNLDASPTPLQGSWDDARLYNRALTLAEIRLLASRRGIGLTPLPDRAAGLPRRFSVNVGGTWRSADAYVNVGGVWKLGQASVNVGGVWK